jgi:hypothetical protein
MAKLEIPPRCSAEECYRRIREFLAEYAFEHRQSGDVTDFFCKRCQHSLSAVSKRVSEHDSRFGEACAGQGETRLIIVPYCTHCDEMPTIGGCIHV